MDKEASVWFEKIERRLSLLEQGAGLNGEVTATWPVIEIDIILPEANIYGLHFNEQKVHGVFGLKEDGWYHSQNILFLSARNTENDNRRDILMKYLKSEEVKKAFDYALAGIIDGFTADSITISLPKENQGVKKYNGGDSGYWLSDIKYAATATRFFDVNAIGSAGSHSASYACGVAPCFRISESPPRKGADGNQSVSMLSLHEEQL
jgi:hypothetical protein